MKVLGFDLGDGESAVALLDSESAAEPRIVPLGTTGSILSAVGIRDGRIVIGEAASVLSGAQDVQVRFKSRYLTDADAAAVVRRFAQGVMAGLMQAEGALMAQVSRTVVGCPAGWGEGRRQSYAALLESAGFPNVSVVPEPRAAFLYARHARGLRVDPALMRTSALVVDIGSSTTDFAYIVDGRQQNQALFGDTNLGGGVLDELILERCIAASADREALERVMRESPAWRSYCELEARRLKERYFLAPQQAQEQGLKKSLIVCYDETLMLDLALDEEAVEAIIRTPAAALGGRSFAACLGDALAAAVRISEDCPPQAVIMTGGATRMAFFREAVRSAFPGSLQVCCPEPECSIARGLAYAGRVDERLAQFRQEIASLARGERLVSAVSAHMHMLYGPSARAMYDTAQEAALEAVALWRRGGIATIAQLEGEMQNRIEAACAGEAAKKRLEAGMGEFADALMQQLDGELTALCLRCGVPPERMTLRGAQVDAGLGGVRLSLTQALGMDVFSGLLGAVLAAVGAIVCGGSGVALVASGPAGLAVGACAGILAALAGKTGVEALVKEAKLPRAVRMLASDKAVRAGLERQREKAESGIVAALADPQNGFGGRLCASLAGTLGSQMERMARDAEMSVSA